MISKCVWQFKTVHFDEYKIRNFNKNQEYVGLFRVCYTYPEGSNTQPVSTDCWCISWHALVHPADPRQMHPEGSAVGPWQPRAQSCCVIGCCLCINTLWVACFRANCSFRVALQVGYSSDVLAFAGSLLFPNLWKGKPQFDASAILLVRCFITNTLLWNRLCAACLAVSSPQVVMQKPGWSCQ